ncbi:MAG TPA: DUF4169 family protein [Rhizomicrobium sp.]|nr:DUF4169 family protein [Rhizomicrobium sp.]
MSEIVNLRNARKAKARSEKEKTAAANRAKHGVAKSARVLAEARDEKAKHDLEAHRLKDKE